MPSVVGLFMQTIVIDALACFTVTPYLVSEEGNMVSNGHAADRLLIPTSCGGRSISSL